MAEMKIQEKELRTRVRVRVNECGASIQFNDNTHTHILCINEKGYMLLKWDRMECNG